MSGHLCLKWNNHSSAFLKNISSIQIKEKYCDATIACQGKYFPVHRIILSTCSDYFDEIFERIQCQHPYIVFKDIEPREMELLLNYMYQGEVNVVQEMLPTLIKAAEALKVKGLAVPDDLPSNKDSSGKKRSNQSNDNPQSKRRLEDSRRRRRDSSELNRHRGTTEAEQNSSTDMVKNPSETAARLSSMDNEGENNEAKLIKEEPFDPDEFDSGAMHTGYGDGDVPSEDTAIPSVSSESLSKEGNIFVNFPITDESAPYIKTEDNLATDEPFQDQSSSWSDFGSGNTMPNLPSTEMSGQDDMSEMNRGSEETGSDMIFQIEPGTSQEKEWTFSYTKSNSEKPSPHTRQCPYCDYQSSGIGNVKRHIRFKHTGERPFPCYSCSRRFTEKAARDGHMRMHTGEKPFECPNCFKRFSHKLTLRKHLLKRKQCSNFC